MQNLCLFPLGKKQVIDMTRKEIGKTLSLWDISYLPSKFFGGQKCRAALASSVEPVLWNAPAAPLHHCFRAPGAVQSQKACHFFISLWDTHSLQMLEQTFCPLALKTFVFCQNSFSGVWLWHCSKAFNKHLNSFPWDKNHSQLLLLPGGCLALSQKTMGFPPSLSILK